MDSLIFEYKKIGKEEKIKLLAIKKSIVGTEGELYGKLAPDLAADTLVNKYHTIVNTKSIDQNQALNDLFELLTGKYQENHDALKTEGEKEVHELLHKESIRSLALSGLIDLAPILLAMLAAFPTLRNKRKR